MDSLIYTEKRITEMYHDLQEIEALHRDLLEELRHLASRIRPTIIPDWE